MNENDFKKKYKNAACTRPPWSSLIQGSDRKKILAKIKQETLIEYGRSLDECPKRLVCMGKDCIGRPLPWRSETAKPYLEKLSKLYKIKDEELYLSNCDTCAISNNCSKPCIQINDFINRWNKKEVALSYKDNMENLSDTQQENSYFIPQLFQGEDIPWDCVSPRRQRVVKKYLYERKTFVAIAKEENLSNQSRVKYEYYAALTKLSEFAIVRRFLKDADTDTVTPEQLVVLYKVYEENKTLTQAAQEIGITKQAAWQRVNTALKAHNLNNKFHKFVVKHQKRGPDGKRVYKTVYNIPEVLR